MKIRVKLMTENDIDVNDVIKAYGITKEEFMEQARAIWNIVAKRLERTNEKCTCESVELIDESV